MLERALIKLYDNHIQYPIDGVYGECRMALTDLGSFQSPSPRDHRGTVH